MAYGAVKFQRTWRTVLGSFVSYDRMLSDLTIRSTPWRMMYHCTSVVTSKSVRYDITLERVLQVIRAASIDMHIWIRKWSVHSRRTVPVGMPLMRRNIDASRMAFGARMRLGAKKSSATAVSPRPTPA